VRARQEAPWATDKRFGRMATMTTQADHVGVLLKICMDIENTAGDIYDCLAIAHVARPHLASLWKKTAGDERVHVEQIAVASKVRRGKIDAVSVPIEEAQLALAKAREVLENIRKAVPDERYALTETLRMERYYSKFHAACVVHFGDSVYQKMFEALDKGDQYHVEELEWALANLEEK
jgi:rubrerythrin